MKDFDATDAAFGILLNYINNITFLFPRLGFNRETAPSCVVWNTKTFQKFTIRTNKNKFSNSEFTKFENVIKRSKASHFTAGLLGRRRRRAGHLPRLDAHLQAPLQGRPD